MTFSPSSIGWSRRCITNSVRRPDEMTRRLVAAIRNPNVDVIGHPTGRILIDKREPSSFDFNEVMRAAAAEGCALEVNSQSQRLDLSRHQLHRRQAGRREAGDLERLALAQGFWIATVGRQPGTSGMDRAGRCSEHAPAQGLASALGSSRLALAFRCPDVRWRPA